MNDETIKRNVIDELYWDSRVDASEIKAEVSNGTVKLEGSVPTYGSKLVARNDAWNIEGVRSVINDLNVRYKMEIPDDGKIKKNVEERLLWNLYLNSSKIDTEVDNGIVTLSGTVDSYWKKKTAESEAERLLGVIDVDNKLGVVPTEDFVDEDIAKDIVDSLHRNINVPSQEVNVNVENGHVNLTGRVPTWNAFYSAQKVAELTLGVVDVKNNIVVK